MTSDTGVFYLSFHDILDEPCYRPEHSSISVTMQKVEKGCGTPLHLIIRRDEDLRSESMCICRCGIQVMLTLIRENIGLLVAASGLS